MGRYLAAPRDWISSLGDIAKFAARDFGEVFGLRVFRFFGEALRQAGVLILGSTIVIWSLAFILGLQCGIEGAYFNRSVGAPAYAGVLYSLIKGMAMATVIVIVGTYYGYTASGGPVGVGTATAKSMVLNTVMVHLVGMLGTQIFWGANPRAPIGG